jgi:hypothetical protein
MGFQSQFIMLSRIAALKLEEATIKLSMVHVHPIREAPATQMDECCLFQRTEKRGK